MTARRIAASLFVLAIAGAIVPYRSPRGGSLLEALSNHLIGLRWVNKAELLTHCAIAASTQINLLGQDDGLSAVLDAQFTKYAGQMRLDSGFGHAQIIGNLLVQTARLQTFQNTQL